MKVFEHLKSNWFRYGFESLAVLIGILAAFALDNWNDQRRTNIAAEVYNQKIISDIIADTSNINGLIEMCQNMQQNINAYFIFFDRGNTPLSELIDSAKQVDRELFRYLPVNYTFIDMQSSGNTILLSDEQRIALIELSNYQEFLQIIIEKVITQIHEEELLRNEYMDFDLSKNDFFESISLTQDQRSKVQGLKHQHNLLTKNHYLAGQLISKGKTIKVKITTLPGFID